MKRLILNKLNNGEMFLMHGEKIIAHGRGKITTDGKGVTLIEADGIGDFNKLAKYIKSKRFNLVIQG